jgi:hypothetical protein
VTVTEEQPGPVVDLRPDWTAQAETATVYVPHTPGVEWFVFAVPVDTGLLDDPGITARQVALDVAAVARETAEPIVYATILERRRG